MNKPMYIAGVGLLTPTGPDLPTNTAAVQAGLCVYDQSSYLDHHGQPVKMALVPEPALPPIAPGVFVKTYSPWQKHLLRLAHSPIQQAMEGYKISHPIPLVINFAESEDCATPKFPSDFVEKLKEQCQAPLSTEHQRLLFSGRAGTLEALSLAERILYERDFDEVLIGGVDSYQDSKRLSNLENQGRLAALGVTDGFTPGEGACFLRLSKNPDNSLFGDMALHSAKIAMEPGHFYSSDNYLGEGLAAAVNHCLANCQANHIETIYLSANGERYWAKETSVALLRNQNKMKEDYHVHHPAEFMGDLGAATGTTLVALAADQAKKTGQLICSSSDRGLRGAVLLSRAAATGANEPSFTEHKQG